MGKIYHISSVLFNNYQERQLITYSTVKETILDTMSEYRPRIIDEHWRETDRERRYESSKTHEAGRRPKAQGNGRSWFPGSPASAHS